MGKVVILDGPRGSGKSTTAQNLVNRFNQDGLWNATYYKKGVREEDEYKNMFMLLNEFYRKGEFDLTIVDRFLITEIVMSIFHERVAPHILSQWKDGINDVLWGANTPHICLIPPISVLDQRLAERIYGDKEKVKAVQSLKNHPRGYDMERSAVIPLWTVTAGFCGAEIIDSSLPSFEENLYLKLVDRL